MRPVRVSGVACPRCGCCMVRYFACNCGAIHGDNCVNCGRSVDAPQGEFLDLSQVDMPCTAGVEPHDHSDSEKCARIAAFFEGARLADA